MATFNTEKLKQMVSYAIQGAGFNKCFDLSTYIGIKVENGILYLNTTDGTNYLRVSDTCSSNDFDVTVEAEIFSKLIGKFNSDTVTMEVIDDTKLEITGNGRYTLELISDENGGQLSFPNKFPGDLTEIGVISANDLLVINNAIKASLSTVAGNVYSNYYFGDIVASTDKAMLSIYSHKLFNEPYLIDRKFIELVSIGTTDATVSKSGNLLVADIKMGETGTLKVCTPVIDTVSDFNVEGINRFVSLDANSFCRFRKAQMLDLLDRLSLFVSKFDDGGISLHFTENYIEVSSLTSNGIEQIDVMEYKNPTDVEIMINIERLRTQLKAYRSDTVDMYYGSDICIKLVDGDISQIIALIRK